MGITKGWRWAARALRAPDIVARGHRDGGKVGSCPSDGADQFGSVGVEVSTEILTNPCSTPIGPDAPIPVEHAYGRPLRVAWRVLLVDAFFEVIVGKILSRSIYS